MRWTRAVTPQPTARLATTATGRPDPLTTAVTAQQDDGRLEGALHPSAQVGQGRRHHRHGGGHPGHRKRQIEVLVRGGRRPSPVLPNTAVAMTQINHAPSPDTATSRMADHRRDSNAMMAMMAMTPSEVIHHMVEISHRMPLGGELNEVATACSALELAR